MALYLLPPAAGGAYRQCRPENADEAGSQDDNKRGAEVRIGDIISFRVLPDFVAAIKEW
jgi:hypothetical protein